MKTACVEVRRGSTLLELLVVLIILSIGAAVSSFAMSGIGRNAGSPTALAAIAAARREAISNARRIALIVRDSSGTYRILALPDGSVLGADRFGVNPRSGRPAHE